MRTFFCLILVLLIISCKRTNKYFEDFDFGKNAYIKVLITNCESPSHFEIYSRHGFPAQAFKYNVRINQDTNFIISLPSNLYDLSFIKIGNKASTGIYTIPGDTLQLILDLDSNLNNEERIKLNGSSAEICNYYKEKMKNWKITRGYDYYYDSTISITKFAEKVDKNRENDLLFLNEYSNKNNLPDWFIDIESSSIIYFVARQKLGILNYHWIFYDSTFNPPDDYYSFLDNIKINNLSAGLSVNYYGFLNLYYSRNFKPGEPGFHNVYHSNLAIIKELRSTKNDLDPRIRDILLGISISTLYREKLLSQTNFSQADTLFELAKPLFEDESLMKIVEDYRDSQFLILQNQAILNLGDDAPGFNLSDIDGRYFKLSDFINKVIYVNFWGIYCTSCIATIPDKNKLVNEFIDQPFELINICLDYRPERWKQIIEENKFQGTHLICKGNWGDKLRDDYLIQTVPHYVLIDKEGKTICNKCESPENIADSLRNIFSLVNAGIGLTGHKHLEIQLLPLK